MRDSVDLAGTATDRFEVGAPPLAHASSPLAGAVLPINSRLSTDMYLFPNILPRSRNFDVILASDCECLLIGGHIFSMADNLDNKIRENADGPAKVTGDAGSVEQHDLSEQIEADRYLCSKEAAKSKSRGLRFNKLVPPGSA